LLNIFSFAISLILTRYGLIFIWFKIFTSFSLRNFLAGLIIFTYLFIWIFEIESLWSPGWPWTHNTPSSAFHAGIVDVKHCAQHCDFFLLLLLEARNDTWSDRNWKTTFFTWAFMFMKLMLAVAINAQIFHFCVLFCYLAIFQLP
jgi:hypothetical protein